MSGHDKAVQVLGDRIAFLEAELAQASERANLAELRCQSAQDNYAQLIKAADADAEAHKAELFNARAKATQEAFAAASPFRTGDMLPVECRSAEALCALAKIAGADVSVDLMAGIKGAVRVVVTCERIGEKFDQLKAELRAAQPAEREWKVGDKARCHVRGAGLRTTPMPVTVIADLGRGWIAVELVGFPYADTAVVHETWLLQPGDEP